MIFDRKAFREYPADWFDRAMWERCDSWWMIVDDRKVGCCAFEVQRKSLYISTTGILPSLRGLGLGSLMKSWQISFARLHGFKRMVAHTRGSNVAMIKLNQKFGFKIARVVRNYYHEPDESAVVMELVL